MRKLLLAGAAALALSGCADRYGRIDPVRSGLLGAGVGAVGGLVAGGIADSGRRHHGYGYGYGGYRPARLPPVAGYGGGYGYGGYGGW